MIDRVRNVMSYSHIRVKLHEPAGTIVLDRPEKRNALNRAMLADLEQAFFDLHQERKVRAVIVSAAGPAFCAGMDLAEMKATSELDEPEMQWGQDAEAYQQILLTMLRFPKPIIATVHGPAVAGGAGLVLASDIVIAGQDARFGLPEPRRGIIAGMVAPLLAFRIGGGHAARLLLQSSLIGADEALRIGVYHELHETDQLWAKAVEIARECARGAPEALQLTKRMINETVGEHLTTLLAAGAAASATARTTDAAKEGLAAFLEEREPEWK